MVLVQFSCSGGEGRTIVGMQTGGRDEPQGVDYLDIKGH